MQFVIIGRDGTDAEAEQRRQAARPGHVAHTDKYLANIITGVATLNDMGQMDGSVMVVDFPTREAMEEWLKTEPYVLRGVWKDITVRACKLGPSFAGQPAQAR